VPPRQRIGIVNLFVTRMLLCQRTRRKEEKKEEKYGGLVHRDCEYSNHCRSFELQPKPTITLADIRDS
jgi:hypothetical protein